MTRILATARANNQDYEVEILNVFMAGDGRQIASIEALPVNGKQVRPFDNYSDRGPAFSSTARVQVSLLRDIRFSCDRTPAQIYAAGGYIWERAK